MKQNNTIIFCCSSVVYHNIRNNYMFVNYNLELDEFIGMYVILYTFNQNSSSPYFMSVKLYIQFVPHGKYTNLKKNC